MSGSIIVFIGLVIFFFAYRFYAGFFQKIFNLAGTTGLTPAHEYRDDIDFSPSQKEF